MSLYFSVDVAGELLELYPHRGAFWPKKKILLLADLHLGKVNHFRKAGIPVPVKANDRNIEQLIDLIRLTQPSRVIFLGDLFHSHYNPEWEVFGEVVRHFAEISFELVVGNHDIMSMQQYERKNITVHDRLHIPPFVFTHHPEEEQVADGYNLAGHVHPGVLLKGRGRQSVTLPCFYFSKSQGFLPAFGSFTGIARIQPAKEDQIFVIADNRIISVA